MNHKVLRRTNTLTAEELIAALQKMIADGVAPDTPVMFSYNYGDHWNTEVCSGIDEPEMKKVTYSDYHDMVKIAELDEDDEETPKYAKPEDVTEVIILNQ